MEAEVERTWRLVARVSGWATGGALFTGTVLYLLDALDLLAKNDYQPNGSGLQDEANFWVAEFARQHHVLWDVIARDTLFPLAFVALIVLGLSARSLVSLRSPPAQLMVSFFVVGGILSALADLIYLASTDYWRETGWSADVPERMVTVGRATQTIGSLTRWPEAAGFVVLAAALVCLGRVCRSATWLPTRLALVAELEALLLLGIAFAGVLESETAYDIFSLLTGALVGPAVAIWLGIALGRGGTCVTPGPVAAAPAP
jgi:hypothetical protein